MRKRKGSIGAGIGKKGGEKEERRRRGDRRSRGRKRKGGGTFILMNVFINRLRIRSLSWLSSLTLNTFQSYT